MKTLLVALLLLVVGTGTASAECAWVLWLETVNVANGVGNPDVQSAYPTSQECGENIRAMAVVLKGKGYDVGGGTKYTTYDLIAKKGKERLHYYCLPDTIDPRGPKGK